MKKMFLISALIVLYAGMGAFAGGEGTRHIVGENISLYFMNDKVFGTVENHPIWAVYNCGTAINGEMDINGVYQPFEFQYAKDPDRRITGTFGPLKMALGKIDPADGKFTYQVLIGDREVVFSIRYETIKDGHMVNSIIEGDLGEKGPVKLVVDGHLCPFATTGIILIVAGSMNL